MRASQALMKRDIESKEGSIVQPGQVLRSSSPATLHHNILSENNGATMLRNLKALR